MATIASVQVWLNGRTDAQGLFDETASKFATWHARYADADVELGALVATAIVQLEGLRARAGQITADDIAAFGS